MGYKERGIITNTKNKYMQVKYINKGCDKVLAKRLAVLAKSHRQVNHALHCESAILEAFLKRLQTTSIKLNEWDKQMMQKRIRKYTNISKNLEHPLEEVKVLWSPRKQTIGEVLCDRHPEHYSVLRRSSISRCTLPDLEKDEVKFPKHLETRQTSSIASITGGTSTDPRTVTIPCRFYKSLRRPVPGCRSFPCFLPKTYNKMDICHSKEAAKASLSSTFLYEDLVCKSGRPCLRPESQNQLLSTIRPSCEKKSEAENLKAENKFKLMMEISDQDKLLTKVPSYEDFVTELSLKNEHKTKNNLLHRWALVTLTMYHQKTAKDKTVVPREIMYGQAPQKIKCQSLSMQYHDSMPGKHKLQLLVDKNATPNSTGWNTPCKTTSFYRPK